MIYNTLALANATLGMFEFLYNEDDNDYLLQAYKGLGESGYTLINHDTATAVSFCQSASGDSLVVYAGNRWKVLSMEQEQLDELGVWFGCDELFKAAKHIMRNLDDK